MTPSMRLWRLLAWAASVNLGLLAVATVLGRSAEASSAVQRLLVLCGLG